MFAFIGNFHQKRKVYILAQLRKLNDSEFILEKEGFTLRKGQAALEFLMTYGWAILVVLIVIGALAYFGVFNPSNLLPERCALQQGLGCQDWKVDSVGNAVVFTLQNGMGTGILIKNVSVATIVLPAVGCINSSFTGTYGSETNVLYIPNGQAVTVPATACTVGQLATMKATNRKYKWAVNVTWFREDSSSAFAHTMTGELLARVE